MQEAQAAAGGKKGGDLQLASSKRTRQDTDRQMHRHFVSLFLALVKGQNQCMWNINQSVKLQQLKQLWKMFMLHTLWTLTKTEGHGCSAHPLSTRKTPLMPPPRAVMASLRAWGVVKRTITSERDCHSVLYCPSHCFRNHSTCTSCRTQNQGFSVTQNVTEAPRTFHMLFQHQSHLFKVHTEFDDCPVYTPVLTHQYNILIPASYS